MTPSAGIVRALLDAGRAPWLAAARWVLERDRTGDGPAEAVASATIERAEVLAVRLDGAEDADAALREVLSSGDAGREVAAGLSGDAWADPERAPHEQRWVRALARAAWRDEVRLRGGDPPATSIRVARGLANVRSAKPIDGRLVDDDGRTLPLVPVTSADLVGFGRAGLAHLGGLTFHRLVRWMVREAHARPGRVRIEGGIAALAERIGAGRGKARDELRDLLDTLQATTIRWDGPAGSGGASLLPWYHVTPAAPGRPALLELDLSPLFEPGLVCRLARRHPDRALVPILPLPRIPLGPRLHPAAARLDWLALVALREGARELVGYGGVRLDWPALARDAGLPVEQLPTLLDAWTSTPARWRRVGPDRWTLAEDDELTREALWFVREGGRLGKGGRRAARRRNRRARG